MGGIDALSLVLQQADGQHKSINDYTLYELAAARIAGAHRPKATHVLKQIVSAITIQFQHKNNTNPTISPQDKIMLALANCQTALASMLSGGPNQQMEEL